MAKNPKYTRRHYEDVARIIATIESDLERATRAHDLAQTYHKDNPPDAGGSYGFRASRWYEACAVPHSIPLFSVHHAVPRTRPTRSHCRICGAAFYFSDSYTDHWRASKCADCYYGHAEEAISAPQPDALLIPMWLVSHWPDTWQEIADRIIRHAVDGYTVHPAMLKAARDYTTLNRYRMNAAQMERHA